MTKESIGVKLKIRPGMTRLITSLLSIVCPSLFKTPKALFLVTPSITNSGTTQVIEKHVAVLKCDATGEPKPMITWQRNGVRVETGLRYFVEEKGSLKIMNTLGSDSGIYVCVAT